MEILKRYSVCMTFVWLTISQRMLFFFFYLTVCLKVVVLMLASPTLNRKVISDLAKLGTCKTCSCIQNTFKIQAFSGVRCDRMGLTAVCVAFDLWIHINWYIIQLKNWWSVPHSTYPYMQARSRNSLYFRGVALVDSHGLCVALIDSQTRCTVQIGYNRYLQTKKGYARQSG